MTNLLVKHVPVRLPTKWAQRQEICCGSKWVMVVHADDEPLTVKEVAQLHKLTTQWVYERCREYAPDRLPHIKLGKYLRFHKSDLIVAVFLTKTQGPVVNCGFCSIRIFYVGSQSMRRHKREMTGVGE